MDHLPPEVLDTTTKFGAIIASSMLGRLLDRGNAKKLKRLEEFFVDHSKRLSHVEAKCDDETLADVVNRIAAAATTDARAEKLYVMGRVLEGTYSAVLDDAHARLFIDLVTRFDVYHLQIVRVLRSTLGADRGTDDSESPAQGFAFLDTQLRERSGRSSPEMTDITTLVLMDLVNAGLLRTRINTNSAGKIMKSINPVGLLRKQVFCLSELGWTFAQYVQDGSSPSRI